MEIKLLNPRKEEMDVEMDAVEGDMKNWRVSIMGRLRGHVIMPQWFVGIVLVMNVLVSLLVFQSHVGCPEKRRFTINSDAALSQIHLQEKMMLLDQYENGKPAEKAGILRTYLKQWEQGPMPELVRILVSMSTTDVVADALIEDPGEDRDSSGILVDVGANSGWPVTAMGMKRNYKHIISVEPLPYNVERLRALHESHHREDTFWQLFPGGAAENSGKMTITFNDKKNDAACFDCNMSRQNRAELSKAEIPITTVDTLVSGFQTNTGSTSAVYLLKSDTQGFEVPVLRGAKQLLDAGQVKHVLVEFDTQLLGSKENGMELLRILSEEAGMECTHLEMVRRHAAENQSILFNKLVPFSQDRIEEFYDTIKELDSATDLFCAQRK